MLDFNQCFIAVDWIIYTLKCPRKGDVRYVGFTSRTTARRLRDHIQSATSGGHSYRDRWILSLVSIGLNPVIEVVESGTGDGWAEAERRWIAAFRLQGARLANATDGGEGARGYACSPNQRAAAAIKARKWQASRTPAERSASSQKANAAQTPEQHAERGRKVNAAMTPEQRSANARRGKAGMTAEQRSAAISKANASRTAEQRSESLRTRWAKLTREQRSAILKRGHVTKAALRAARARLAASLAQSEPAGPLEATQRH